MKLGKVIIYRQAVNRAAYKRHIEKYIVYNNVLNILVTMAALQQPMDMFLPSLYW